MRDLVITDHTMPHMTGAAHAKHTERPYPDVAVIVDSGYEELSKIDRSLVKRLQKLFSQRQLKEAVDAAIAGFHS